MQETRTASSFKCSPGVLLLLLLLLLLQAWRASGCMSGLDWSSLRCFSSTGEASAPDDTLWLSAKAGYKPVIEYCGGRSLQCGWDVGGGAMQVGSRVFLALNFVPLGARWGPRLRAL